MYDLIGIDQKQEKIVKSVKFVRLFLVVKVARNALRLGEPLTALT